MPGAFDVDEENRIIYGYNSEFFEDGFLKFTFSLLWFDEIKLYCNLNEAIS